jgi:hypothetical protein
MSSAATDSPTSPGGKERRNKDALVLAALTGLGVAAVEFNHRVAPKTDLEVVAS